MATKLFVLGLPGSGKSMVVRHIAEMLEKAYLKVSRRNDFEILKLMYENDRDGIFKSANSDGVFDVVNFEAFNIASKRLGEVVSSDVPLGDDAVTIIEFSRNNYEMAFSYFPLDFLSDAYYLHLGTSLQNCKERVHQRSSYPVYKDDYPVSNYIFREYYQSDDGERLPEILNRYGVKESQILILANNGSFEEIVLSVEEFATSKLVRKGREPISVVVTEDMFAIHIC